jgi:hypothetical protein
MKKLANIGDKILVFNASTTKFINELDVVRVTKTMAFASNGIKFRRINYGYLWRIDMDVNVSNEFYRLK